MLTGYFIGALFVGLLGGALQLSEYFARPRKRKKSEDEKE